MHEDIPVKTCFFASSSCPAPCLIEKFAAVPSPSNIEIPVVKVTVGNTAVVAAFPKTPITFPIKIWSTILYRAATTMLITQGIENLFIRLPIFAVPKSNSFIVRILLFHKMKMSNKKRKSIIGLTLVCCSLLRAFCHKKNFFVSKILAVFNAKYEFPNI